MHIKPTLLAVDDNSININILVELLGQVYELAVAQDGKSALDILEKQPIDLVLLDIIMPDMDGYEVCRSIKKNKSTQHIPVIFITAKTDEESIEKAYNVGGVDYATKPFKPRELLARIRTQLKLKELIEALQHSREELKHLSETDSMTGLWNRRYFTTTAQAVCAMAQREQTNLSIVMIDIDRFKQINDTYGHHVGDEVIIALANVLKKSIRQSDLACRFGGEEFVLLLPETSQYGAQVMAEKIRQATERNGVVAENGDIIHFTISLGISEIDFQHDSNIETAIKRADQAMYRAKESGRNCIVSYYP